MGARHYPSRSRSVTTDLGTTSTPTKTKRWTPYHRDFEKHLTDDVRPVYTSQKPDDLEEVLTAMTVPRQSLSPTQVTDDAFMMFVENNDRAKDEDDVMANVIPAILGPSRPTIASARNTIFGNLEPLIDDTLSSAMPDIYDGAYPEQLLRSIRNVLGHHIIPSTRQDKPLAPNFFVEVKGPDGSSAVAERQARYNGALGSRGMHSLQNYGNEQPLYDNRAYTFSSTYADGILRLFAHHTTPPAAEGKRPVYHMARIDVYAMTKDRDTFVEGATAFRNIRDLAKRHRDSFIEAANAKAAAQTRALASRGPVEPGKDAVEKAEKARADANSNRRIQGGGKTTAVSPAADSNAQLCRGQRRSAHLAVHRSPGVVQTSSTASRSTTKVLRQSRSPRFNDGGSRSSKRLRQKRLSNKLATAELSYVKDV